MQINKILTLLGLTPGKGQTPRTDQQILKTKQ